MKTRLTKGISVLLVTALIAILFSGCSLSEKKLYDAFMKTKEIESIETKSKISAKVDIKGLSEEEQLEAEKMISMINNSSIEIIQKAKMEEDNLKEKAQSDININLAGVEMKSGVWIDADITGDKFEFTEIIKLPKMMMLSAFPNSEGKDYIVLNSEELNKSQKETNPGMDLVDFSKNIQKFQPKVEDFFKTYIENFDFDEKLVDYKGKEDDLKVYEVELDNDTFKDFVQYSIESAIENEELDTLIEEYFKLVLNMGNSMEDLSEVERQQMETVINDLTNSFNDEQKEKMLDKIDEFFESIEDIEIIGEDGIKIEYKINEDGYIVAQDWDIHITINQQNIEEELKNVEKLNSLNKLYKTEQPNKEQIDKEPVIIDIKLNITNETLQINEDIDFEFPEITEENSMSYMELINPGIPTYPTGTPARMKTNLNALRGNLDINKGEILVDGIKIQTKNSLIIEESEFLVPLRPVVETLGYQLKWDPQTQKIKGIKNQNTFFIELDNPNIMVNGQNKTLDVAPRLINGQTYIPLTFISNNFYVNVFFDNNTKTIIIETK